MAMRICTLRFGRLDERVAEIVDDQREETFRASRSVEYVPISKLPNPDYFGYSARTARVTAEWCRYIEAAKRSPKQYWAHRRVLITGPSGCGTTSLAYVLAARGERPLLRINPESHLRAGGTSSGSALRDALWEASSLTSCVVLLDEVSRYFPLDPVADRGIGAALKRTSGVILEWLDNLPDSVIVVATAKSATALSAQLRWRLPLHIVLDRPVGDIEFRTSVFAALLRRYQLDELASDRGFVSELASATDPENGLQNQPRMADVNVRLRSCADIEQWICDKLYTYAGAAPGLLSNSTASPSEPDFWRRSTPSETRTN